MALIEGITLIIFPIGASCSGQIFKYGGYYTIYIVALASVLVGIVYTAFMPETIPEKNNLNLILESTSLRTSFVMYMKKVFRLIINGFR